MAEDRLAWLLLVQLMPEFPRRGEPLQLSITTQAPAQSFGTNFFKMNVSKVSPSVAPMKIRSFALVAL